MPVHVIRVVVHVSYYIQAVSDLVGHYVRTQALHKRKH